MENDAVMAEELIKVGFECFEEKPSFRRFRHRLQPFLILDLMRVNAATFEKMWAASEDYDLDGILLKIPALAHLLALKLHAAQNEHRVEKDLSDVLALLRANPGKISAAELRTICDQYGTPAIAEKLSAFL